MAFCSKDLVTKMKHSRWESHMEKLRIKAEQIKLKMHRKCAWCSSVIEQGEPGALTSHGLCEACAEAFLKQAGLEKEAA